MFSITCRWLAKSPCEKLSRAMFIPARMICARISGACDAGPIVATILVLWLGRFMILHLRVLQRITPSENPLRRRG